MPNFPDTCAIIVTFLTVILYMKGSGYVIEQTE